MDLDSKQKNQIQPKDLHTVYKKDIYSLSRYIYIIICNIVIIKYIKLK